MKKYKKIVLAGGSGHIGHVLTRYFADASSEIIILTRGETRKSGNIQYVNWDAKNLDTWFVYLENADVLINLVGKNVNCRYNEKNKKEIIDSRVDSVKVLAAAIKSVSKAPKLWIQSASATIYRYSEDKPMTEENGEIGEGFSVEVCKVWEKTFIEETESLKHTRKIIFRTGIVMGKTEGVYLRLKNLVKFGLGGKQGDGKQFISWIHEEDLFRMVEWVMEHKDMNGVFNCTAPQPIRNSEFMQLVRKNLKMPIALPSPKWLLELGAIIIRTETELILKSRRVVPERIILSGFTFKFPDGVSLLNNICKK